MLLNTMFLIFKIFSSEKNKLWKNLQWRFSMMDFIKQFKDKKLLHKFKVFN